MHFEDEKKINVIAGVTIVILLLLASSYFVFDWLIASGGPGNSDFTVAIGNGYELWRFNGKDHQIFGPQNGKAESAFRTGPPIIDRDVVELMIDLPFIACRRIEASYDNLTTQKATGAQSWLIVDTSTGMIEKFDNEVDFRSRLAVIGHPGLSVMRDVESFRP